MRILEYPFKTNLARLCDLYQKTWGEFEIKQGENLLNLTKREFSLKDSYGNTFYIHDGQGVLEWEDAKLKLDFCKLEAEVLDNALQGKSIDSFNEKLVQAFIRVYEKNIEKGFYYLNPFGFSKLDLKLIKGGY